MKRMLAACVAALIALTSCRATEPAAPEQELTVYSGRSQELVEPLFDRFEKASGVRLKVRYGDTAELAAQILEEGDNSPADVFFAQDAGALGALQKKGRFIDLSQNITSKTRTGFHSKKWTGISGRARVAVYNPDRVKTSELPTSILGFTDPKWKDRIGWAPANGSFQSFVTAFRKLKGDERAKEWLTALKANGTKSYPKNDTIVQAVSTGEVDAGFVNHYYVMELASKDPNLKAKNHFFGPGDVGALVNVAGAGILDTSKAAKAAEQFLEFLLSPASQRYFRDETFEYALIDGVDTPEGLPPLDRISSPKVDLTDLNDLEGTLNLLKEVGLL